MNVTQGLAEQSAENLLRGMEAFAKQDGTCTHILDERTYDDIYIRDFVQVRFKDDKFRYYKTDGWGNSDWTDRQGALNRIAAHKAQL